MIMYIAIALPLFYLATTLALCIFKFNTGFGQFYIKLLLNVFRYVSINKSNSKEKSRSVDGNESNDEVYEDAAQFHRSYAKIMSSSPRFNLADVIQPINMALNVIIDDDVTKRFRSVEELDVWNLLTRTGHTYHVSSKRAWIIWFFGFAFRYVVLLPLRLILFLFGLMVVLLYALLVNLIPIKFARYQCLHSWISRVVFRVMSRAFCAVIKFHNPENKARSGAICVANHTSPIDVIILSTDNTFTLIGQKHSRFFGFVQKALKTAGDHIWFDRSESSDRVMVARRMQEYVSKPNSLPILIFPEGTCINNTSVMMFRKGCFEVDTTIYPVAIKYDARLGDPFWNSSRYGFLHYFFLMMTSWAIAVDVYYLQPMSRCNGESAIMFAKRVKSAIAEKGGFVNMDWDGMLKRTAPKKELKKQEQLKIYNKQFKND